MGPTRDSLYAAALEREIARDRTHELSARAIASLASLRFEQDDAVAAHEIAERGVARFPDSIGGHRCWNLIQDIEARSISVTASDNVWNRPAPTLSVTYRNLDHVYFRLVPVDFEGELRAGRQPTEYGYSEERLKALIAKTPSKQWSARLPATSDYKVRTERLPVPGGTPFGAYYLISSARADFADQPNTIALALVWVSDLAIVIRDGRPTGCEGFVLDAVSGAPLANVEVRSWQHKVRWDGNEPGPTTRTDRNGMFRIAETGRTQHVIADNGRQRLALSDYFPNYQPRPAPATERTVFFTDRAIYRPGQVIQYKAVCARFDTEKNDYSTIASRAVTVSLVDPNGREVAKADHTTSPMGSFSGSFVAPEGGLRGAMHLEVTSGPRGSEFFRVEEYKRPKFLVTLDDPRVAARLAGRVELSGRALGYTGAPVDGAKVEWSVMRQVRYPDWWHWRFGWFSVQASDAQAIAHGTATTDADGRFPIAFTALPDSSVPAEQEPVFQFAVNASVTDGAGESHSQSRTVSVAYTALAASLTAPEWLEAARPVELTLRTLTLDGEGQIASGTVTLKRLKSPEHFMRSDEPAPDYQLGANGEYSPRANRSKRQITAPAAEEDIARWAEGAVVTERAVRTDSSGNAKVSVSLEAGAYLARFETRDRFGRAVTAIRPLRVLDPAADRLRLGVRDLFAVREDSVEPGAEFLALWGTGCDSARVFVEIETHGRMLQSFWTTARQTQLAIRQRVDESMRGGFTVRVTRVAENRAYLHEQYIGVPWSDRRLSLKWEHFVSKLEPGKPETWTAVVSGPDAARAPAEMVATLYDASLDAFATLAWSGLAGFRINYDQRSPRFGVREIGLAQVRGYWPMSYRDGSLWYRHFPGGLLWGDFNYGFDLAARPDGSLGVVQGAEESDQGNGYGRSRGGRNFPASAPMQAIRGIAVDNLSEAIAAKAGIVAKDGDLHFRGGRADEPKIALGSPGQAVNAVARPGPAPNLDAVVARGDLRETAFFFPRLSTGSNGEVRMEFTMPEALTQWRFLGFAHDNRLRSGTLTGTAVTSKDLMVQPNPPRFLREGDEVEFTVKVTNRRDTPQRGKVRLQFTAAIGDVAADAALGNRSPEQALEVPANASRTYSWRIHVPDGIGVLRYKAVAASARLSDGEEGWLPVLARRVLVTESLPLPIRGPASKNFEFTRLIHAGDSPTLRQQSLTVQMVSNPAWYAVMALPYLIEYPWECSEQTFNRLYANSLARFIANSDPRIRKTFDRWRGTPALDSPLEKSEDLKSVLISETPWLRQAQAESQARRNVGILFQASRLDAETARLLDKLEAMQLPDGMWPWFPGGRGNEYITLYITTGFGRLRHLGVEVRMTAPLRSIERLDAWADEMYRDILRAGDPKANHLSPTIALYLYGRSFFLTDRPVAKAHQEAFAYWLTQARTHWLEVSDRQTRGHLALALMRTGDQANAQAIMRSVKEYSVSSEELGMFWRDTEYSWWWYRAPIETQALMIEAFDEVMSDSTAVEDCRMWLLKQKQTQDWKTTKATADAVYALMLRGPNLLASQALVQVTLGDSLVRPASTEAGTGFYEKRFAAGAIRPEMGHVRVVKSDPGVAWGSVHWQYLEDMDKITAYTGTPLTLVKKLFLKVNGKSGPELHAVEGPIHVGDELVVRVELRTDRDMEYVHLKDYRGSGVEPVNVLSGYRYQDGLAYYEETRDVASHFFIDYLPKGTYVFEYS
ncbi:MAG: alpha-2-macroglobulin family protein, partial [Candidatus Eiseniibacteriota bacterium]